MSSSPCSCFHLFVSMLMSPCLYVHASMSTCFYVCFHTSCLCLYLHVSMSPCPCLNVSGMQQTENRTNGKQQLLFVCCKRKTETANFRLFAANRNGKRKFVFLGQQMINGIQRLLSQQMSPFMLFLKKVCLKLNKKGGNMPLLTVNVEKQENVPNR
jgi:hypothetical protein